MQLFLFKRQQETQHEFENARQRLVVSVCVPEHEA
jgi:hypothetical protein